MIHFPSSLFRNNTIRTNILISAIISFLAGFFSTFFFTFLLGSFAFLSNIFFIYTQLPYFIPTFFLVAFILSFLVLTHFIVKDLKVINRSIRTIANGDLGYRFPDMQISEFKNFSINLNTMLNQIQNEAIEHSHMEDAHMHLMKAACEELYVPVNQLISNVQHLYIHSAKKSQQYVHLLQVIHEDALQLKEIMDDLFELARHTFTENRLNLIRTDLSLFVDEVILGLIPFTEKKGISIKKETILFPVYLPIDITKMTMAITHLFKIHTSNINNNRVIRFTMDVENNNIVFSMENQTESEFDAAQNPLMIKSHRTLALSIARTIIEKHGGSLSLSHINNTVLIRLPLDRQGSPQ
ncbi:hypothetical protein A7K91_20230 [Paenibacillus oryzae]|uniref:histidine kinase n=1 Tax=Paenibacillus oryzae TaxID=1844972 RepID=A0A1A5YEM9_9BACL|nr:HAMP domain-containing histidine kinase [Paenibacillus oryzae]OBR64022.1 hypothetical protein A7K91_20230 [Paenibacillus oryzae]